MEINPSKRILVWKASINKVMTEEQRNKLGMNQTGHSWEKNMSEENRDKWIAKLFPKAKRIEIQKSFPCADLKIVISKAKTHTKITGWDRRYFVDKGINDEYIISLGQNGTSLWEIKDVHNFYQAIQEAIHVLENL